jgi:hypothetical protein
MSQAKGVCKAGKLCVNPQKLTILYGIINRDQREDDLVLAATGLGVSSDFLLPK